MSDEERSVQAEDNSSSYLASPEEGKPFDGRESVSSLQGVSP